MSAMNKSEIRSLWDLSTSTKDKEQSKRKRRLLCKRGRDHQMSVVTLILLLRVKLKLPLSVLKLKRLVPSLSLLDLLKSYVIMKILKCLSMMNFPSLLIRIPYCVHQSTAHRFSLTQIIITKFNRCYGINKCISDLVRHEFLLVNNNCCCVHNIHLCNIYRH
jgi:hypothetical protein